MEERHKRILQRNRVNLVRDLNPSDMYHGLLSKGIFTQDMIDEIKSSGIRQDQARQLVRDLETRGSLAFPALIECLHETGQHSLAELLLDGEPQNQPLPQPVHVRPVVRPLPVSPEGEFGKPRTTGRVRRDSIQVCNNRFPGAVHGVDGPNVPVQHITNYLNGQNCLSLQGKPKIFFIQACGGGERDTGFEVSPDEARPCIGGTGDQTDAMPMSSSSDSLSTQSDEPDAKATLPTASDILVSYSTFPGYVSWRDTQAGSWYVETLDNTLEENAATDDLVTMLMMVNHEVSEYTANGLYKQMSGSFNFLRKLLYFQSLPCQRPIVS